MFKDAFVISQSFGSVIKNSESFIKTTTRSVRRTGEKPVHHFCINFSVI
jgi:hypothetical protein